MKEKRLLKGYKTRRLDLEHLTKEEIASCRSLVPEPNWIAFDEGKSPTQEEGALPLAVALIDQEERIVGVAVASYSKTFSISVLHSFSIEETQASEELKELLIEATQHELSAEKSRIVSYYYKDDGSLEAEAAKAFFFARDWSQPKLFLIRCYFDCYAFNPDWFQKTPPVKKPYSLFPWNELTLYDKELLKHYAKQGRINRTTYPFQQKEYTQPINSLGLKYKEEVVGWMLTHTLPEKKEIIRYTALFLYPEFRSTGNAISLLKASIQLQKASALRFSFCEFEVGLLENSWVSFVKKRLIPYTTETEYIYRISKLI